MRRSSIGGLLSAPLLALFLAAPAVANEWQAWSGLDTIEVVTQQPDGSERATTIWILVQDGTAYVRTNASSAWGDEVEAARLITLRSDAGERAARATPITDAATRSRVEEGFNAKYGFQDSLIGLFRGGDARIWSLQAASP